MASFLAVLFTLAMVVGCAQGAILDTFLRQSAGAAPNTSCKADSDCNRIDRDALLLKCQAGVCVPSSLGADCGSSLECSTFTWCGPGAKCARGLPGADCTTWRQCDSGSTCISGKCAAAKLGSPCTFGYNCREGETCEYSKCVPGTAAKTCRTDFDCAGKCTLNIIGNFVSGFCTTPPPPPSPKPVAPAPVPAPTPAAPAKVEPAAPAAPTPAAPAPKPATAPAPKPAPAAKPAAPAKPATAPAAPASPANPVAPAQPAPTPAAPAADASTPQTNAEPDSPVSDTNTDTVAAEPTPGVDAAPAAGTETLETSTDPELGDVGANTGSNQRVCIGASSHVSGVKFSDSLHPSMRMQVHPLRILQRKTMVDMLCYTAGGSRLCASATHVVVADGKHMYMSQLCAARNSCTAVRDYPLNFKGACGLHLQFMKGVHATQHAASDYSLAAEVVARQECAARDSNRAAWFLTTL